MGRGSVLQKQKGSLPGPALWEDQAWVYAFIQGLVTKLYEEPVLYEVI